MSILRTSHGSWTYDFWHLGKRYRKRFKSRVQALEAEACRRLAVKSNPSIDGKLTFKDAASLFLENHAKPNKASWDSDQVKARVLGKLFGGKRLVEFTPLDIQMMRSLLTKKGLSSRTVDRYHAFVKTLFNKMIIWRKFEGFNPAKGVQLKLEPNAHVRFLSQDEAQRLEMRLSGANLYPYYIGAIQTGMRLGELCSVKWADVTFPIRDIYVPKSKSGKSRHIPISDTLYTLLENLYGNGKDDQELVFGKLTRFSVSHRFVKVCRDLGIKDFRFHDLRHTFASQLVMAGVNIFKVSKWLGHTTVTTTEKYYAHLSPDQKREDINCLNKLSSCTGNMIQTNNRQTTENNTIQYTQNTL